MHWKEELLLLCDQMRYEPTDNITLKKIEALFRLKRPGPYILLWGDSEFGTRTISLKFICAEDITWWMLQNAD